MKITSIRMMRLRGPRYHGVGGEADAEVSKVIIRVDADNGQHGLGECDNFMGVEEGITYMDSFFRGRDAFAANALVSEMLYGTASPHPKTSRNPTMPPGMHGVAFCSPTATAWGPPVWTVSGVEIALCDLIGKTLGTPAYNLLGGRFREQAKVYLDRSSPADITDLAAWRAMAESSAAEGFSQLKFDIDFMATESKTEVWNRSLTLGEINRIVERLTAVRETVGPDFELCVDCHMQYNALDAIRVAEALAPLNLLWLEDPTPITNPDSCAEVRSRSPIPICVGEMFIAEQARLFVDHQACDILHPDILVCGGMHEQQRIAQYAELHHRPVAFHGNGGALATIAAAHVGVACRNLLGIEYHFIETPWIGEYVKRDVPLFRDGHIPLTDAPGLGVELDREVCAAHLAAGQSLFD
jgi:L-alanine-DL-glutamate epimerase-like enolase superfamily enzyme